MVFCTIYNLLLATTVNTMSKIKARAQPWKQVWHVPLSCTCTRVIILGLDCVLTIRTYLQGACSSMRTRHQTITLSSLVCCQLHTSHDLPSSRRVWVWVRILPSFQNWHARIFIGILFINERLTTLLYHGKSSLTRLD